jgi:hypothetical protein
MSLVIASAWSVNLAAASASSSTSILIQISLHLCLDVFRDGLGAAVCLLQPVVFFFYDAVDEVAENEHLPRQQQVVGHNVSDALADHKAEQQHG